ncbi:MAG: hypothetical protein IJE68_01780 [Clostridia bacterium]|nr:hypothetical protein [Clostridia bacterium]
MKKIGFVGAYDKTDIILSIAKILTMVNKKVLILDNTITQKCKYIVPVINPTKSYITTYEDIDVAVGFENIEKLKQYIGLQENENLDYDFFIIDTDNFEGFATFGLQSSDKIYFVTSYDSYSLKKGIEILSQLGIPKRITGIFFSKDMLKEEENYFEYLALGTKVIWDESKIYFPLENGDFSAIMENQRISKIKFRNLSNEYRDNIQFLTNSICPEIGEKTIKNIIKEL